MARSSKPLGYRPSDDGGTPGAQIIAGRPSTDPNFEGPIRSLPNTHRLVRLPGVCIHTSKTITMAKTKKRLPESPAAVRTPWQIASEMEGVMASESFSDLLWMSAGGIDDQRSRAAIRRDFKFICDFVQDHGLSLDWMLWGDIGGLISHCAAHSPRAARPGAKQRERVRMAKLGAARISINPPLTIGR